MVDAKGLLPGPGRILLLALKHRWEDSNLLVPHGRLYIYDTLDFNAAGMNFSSVNS